MSDYDLRRQIVRERRRPMIRKRPPANAWEKARERFDKKNLRCQMRERFACVCSHSKYHHRLIDEDETESGEIAWAECEHKKKCGCSYYEEIDWKGV